jgi:hypothetical protein
MSLSPRELSAVVDRAVEAYTHGRLDESRRLVSDALAHSPEAVEIRQLAERLFPELVAAPGAPAATSTPWETGVGADVLDVDWGAVAAPLERSPPASAPSPQVEASSEASPPPPETPAPEPSRPPEAAPDPSPPEPVAAASWAEALDTPWDEAMGLSGGAEAPPAGAGDDPWGPMPGAQPMASDGAPGLDLLAEPPAAPRPSGATDPAGSAPADPEPPVPEPDPKAEEVANLMQGARELHELGDFSGSLELVEKALEVDPESAEAQEYLSLNEATLIQMYESKLGSPDAVPQVAIPPDEVVWLNLDHRAGFLLAQIDGIISLEDLYTLSGMSRLDTSRILAQLVEEGVILTG